MKPRSSNYINSERRDYALYVLRNRAIPAITDGLKNSGRRVLWTGRDGHKRKTAVLAGATMSIHPHDLPDDPINTLTATYGNNIPLFKGFGAFGTLIDSKSYGAARYTDVQVSKFTKDVIFRDIDIIPMTDNYDGSEMEPVHFLPLVPIALVNPSSGVAIGFASNILPRTLGDIIESQLIHLKKQKKQFSLNPTFTPLDNACHETLQTDKGIAYYFNGEYTQQNATTITITKIPYTQLHENVIEKIKKEFESGNIVDFNDKSRDMIEIVIKFKKGFLNGLEKPIILQRLGLTVRKIENLNVLDFTGDVIQSYTPEELIKDFTDWRLTFYEQRYQNLHDLLMIDIQRYLDILTAIKNNVGSVARKTANKSELKEYLTMIKIVYVDYIADLPVYRFTEEEKTKTEEKLVEANKVLAYYNELLASPNMRKDIYISELQEILTKYNKGFYKEI